MRKEDIAELVTDSFRKLKSIKAGQIEIDKVTIKNIFENLRSCLDYSAIDIAEKIGSKKTRIYFPYGETKEDFEEGVRRNIGDLKRLNEDVFNLIEGLQKYKTTYYWLGYLCSSTTKFKHNRLNQFRTKIKRWYKIEGTSSYNAEANIWSKNLTIKNKWIGELRIEGGKIYTENEDVKIELIEEERLVLDDSGIDAVYFLEKCVAEIEKYIEKLYIILEG